MWLPGVRDEVKVTIGDSMKESGGNGTVLYTDCGDSYTNLGIH